MDKETKMLAYQAIDENVSDSTARKIIRYVMECELNGFDTIRQTNAYIAEKFHWTIDTTKVAIAKAKKSQFITTTGRDKSRTFELNVQFLKGKMGEIVARKPLRKGAILLQELANVAQEPNHLPNHLPNLEQGANNKDNYNNKNNTKELGRAKALPPSYFDVSLTASPCGDAGTEGSLSNNNVLTNIKHHDTLDVSKTNVGEKGNNKVDYKGIVSEVASILGLQKVAWGQAIKTCKQCIENGFTKDDIIAAANNMKAGDRRYYSIYSLFIKTDYWLNKTEQSDDKGKLSW